MQGHNLGNFFFFCSIRVPFLFTSNQLHLLLRKKNHSSFWQCVSKVTQTELKISHPHNTNWKEKLRQKKDKKVITTVHKSCYDSLAHQVNFHIQSKPPCYFLLTQLFASRMMISKHTRSQDLSFHIILQYTLSDFLHFSAFHLLFCPFLFQFWDNICCLIFSPQGP